MSTLLRSPSPFEPADSLLSSSSIILEASGIHEKAISGALLALPSYVPSGPAPSPSSGLVQRIRIPLGTKDLYNSASNGSCASGNGERVVACWRAVVRYLSSFVSAGGETAAVAGEGEGETAAAADSADPAGDGSGSVSTLGAGGVTCYEPVRNIRFERALWDLPSMADAVCVPAEEDRDVRVVVGEILGKLNLGGGVDVGEVAGEDSEAAVGDFIMVNICDRYIELVPGIVATGVGEQQEQDVSHCGSGF